MVSEEVSGCGLDRSLKIFARSSEGVSSFCMVDRIVAPRIASFVLFNSETVSIWHEVFLERMQRNFPPRKSKVNMYSPL